MKTLVDKWGGRILQLLEFSAEKSSDWMKKISRKFDVAVRIALSIFDLCADDMDSIYPGR